MIVYHSLITSPLSLPLILYFPWHLSIADCRYIHQTYICLTESVCKSAWDNSHVHECNKCSSTSPFEVLPPVFGHIWNSLSVSTTSLWTRIIQSQYGADVGTIQRKCTYNPIFRAQDRDAELDKSSVTSISSRMRTYAKALPFLLLSASCLSSRGWNSVVILSQSKMKSFEELPNDKPQWRRFVAKLRSKACREAVGKTQDMQYYHDVDCNQSTDHTRTASCHSSGRDQAAP